MDNKNYENISDGTTAPVSEDTKGDGIIHPKMPKHLAASVATSTLDPDDMKQ